MAPGGLGPGRFGVFGRSAIVTHGVPATLSAAKPSPTQGRELVPAPAVPAVRSQTKWLFANAGFGLEIRLSPEGWAICEPPPNGLGSFHHEPTGSLLLVLDEGESVVASDAQLAILEGFAKDLCDRYVPGHEDHKFVQRTIAANQARVFLVATETHAVPGALLDVNGRLIKLLLLIPQAHKGAAEDLANQVFQAIQIVKPAESTVAPGPRFAPYDVRLGIPASRWAEAISCTPPKKAAVADNGRYVGVVTQEALNHKLQGREYGDHTLVLTPVSPAGKEWRWQTIAYLRWAQPEWFDAPPSPYVERMQTYGPIALAIGGGIGLIGGIIYASMTLAMAEALKAGLEALVVVAAVPLSWVFGFFLLKGAGRMASKGNPQALYGFLLAMAAFCAPFVMLGFAWQGIVTFVVGVAKWIGLVLLVTLLAALGGGLIGLGVAAIVVATRGEKAAESAPAKPAVPPRGVVDLLTQ
jgi:hypothetical protein